MTAPHRLFVETIYHPAFRYGGWGIVWDLGGVVAGQAGGDRGTTAERIDLMALTAALEGLPAAAISIHSASAGVLKAARALAAGEAPAEDLDLWAQAVKAAHGRALTVKAAAKAPNTPAAFLHAWAEAGQDKAKAKGRFSAAIPKPNLARLVLP